MDINLLHSKPLLAEGPEQNQANRYGFTAGHFGLIALCLALLLTFSVVKGNLSWSSLVNVVHSIQAAAPEPHVMTYDEAAQVAANQAPAASATDDSQALQQAQQQQLAQVDPSLGDSGQVLGASTDALPSIDQMFTEQKLSAIQLSLIQNATPTQRQQYATQVKFVESYYGTGTLLSALTTQDKDQLTQAEQGYANIITELGQIKVPTEFEQYHKLKMIYYSTLMAMANSMAGNDPNADMSTAGTIFFGLNDKLNTMAADLSSRYGVSL